MVRRRIGKNPGVLRRRVASHAYGLCLFAAAVIGVACGSSSRTSTGPTPLKCQPSVALSTQSVGAVGGTATLSVTTQQECAWSVTSEVAWISGLSPAAGQGSARVAFSVATNPEAAVRQGDLVLNDQRIRVRQEAAACKYEIAPRNRSLDADGDEWEVRVSAVTGCTWRATSNVAWMAIKAGETGTRDGVVVIEADTNSDQNPRTGSLMIAGESFAVVQGGIATAPPAPPGSPAPPVPEPICAFTLSPATHAAPAAGATGTTAIQATHPGCVWSVSSDAAWLTPSTGVGVGSQSLAFSVAANAGAVRTGRLTIGGQLFTVTQAAATIPGPVCQYSLNPTSLSVGTAGVIASSVAVTAGVGCSWTATTASPWILITSGASGTGPGTVLLSVGVNSGAARTGAVTIAGQTFSVTQAAAPLCSYSINPASQSVGAVGGGGTITVTTAAGCSWSATTSNSWISVVSGTSGSGNGTATITIASNPGAARVGTVTVAGQTYTVNQAAATTPPPPPPNCSYTITPTSQSISAGGATRRTIDVDTSNNCAWTASSNAPWISIRSGASDQGDGAVEYDVSSNPGPARQGTLTVAGHTFTVNQAGQTCTYSINPTSQSFSLLGGSGSVSVSAPPGCSWTAASNNSWITVTQGGAGTGNATVVFTVAPNLSGSRTGTLTIAGRTFTVTQN
ncbi:MAG TPA: BACON domain-containing carbohydrate-binding protein [Vicinamibacterales bacterium]|nr:BACON domain-containing carbohydrate-binding protein [Vicinamibacterales bacterium]